MLKKKYASLAILLGPLLEPYLLPGTSITLDTVFLFFNCLVLLFIGKRQKIIFPKYYLLFFFYAIIIPPLVSIFYGYTTSIQSSYISIVLYTLCLILYTPYLDIDIIKKVYGILVLIVSIVFILQEVMYATFGYRFSALIAFLPVKYSYTSMSDFMVKQMFMSRSSSLFLEPAHFAQFLLGYLAILLGDSYNKKRLINIPAIITSLILLLTWSGNGILIAVLLWVMFILFVKVDLLKKIFLITPLVILLIIYSFNYIISTEQGAKILERTEELDANSDRVSSGTMRIYRGYYVFEDMSLFLKTTGVGTGATSDVIDDSSVKWMFHSFEHYLNNAQILLIAYGVLGTFFFMFHIFYLIRYNTGEGKFLIIAFLGLSFIESFWGGSKMLLYIAISFLLSQKYIQKKYENNVSVRNPS